MKTRLMSHLALALLLTAVSAGQALAAPVRGVALDNWADTVIGKSGFGEATANNTTAKRVFAPGGVLVDRSSTPNRLYVYDSGNNRVLGLSNFSNLVSGMTADIALGQPDLIHGACNGDSNFQNYPNPAVPSAYTLAGIAQD